MSQSSLKYNTWRQQFCGNCSIYMYVICCLCVCVCLCLVCVCVGLPTCRAFLCMINLPETDTATCFSLRIYMSLKHVSVRADLQTHTIHTHTQRVQVSNCGSLKKKVFCCYAMLLFNSSRHGKMNLLKKSSFFLPLLASLTHTIPTYTPPHPHTHKPSHNPME